MMDGSWQSSCGVTVFFVAAPTRALGIDGEIAEIIESTGFELLRKVELEEASAMPWSFGGSPPVQMIVALDVLPSRVREPIRKLRPGLDNGRIHEAALRCREYAAAQSASQPFEPVRPVANAQEAWAVIRQIIPDEEQALREEIEQSRSALMTEFPVIRDLSRLGARAKIELIDYNGRPAVKKTFRANSLRFMEREVAFMTAVSPARREIPPVLETGPNFFIVPFIEGRPLRRTLFGRGFPRLMTLKQVREVADLLRYLFAHGYDPVDLGPHNLLVDAGGRVTAIDFEFVHRSDTPVEPEESACLTGLRSGFEGEWPSKARWVPRRAKSLAPWRLRWRGCTGLTLESFLYDPPWLQSVKRTVNYPAYLTRKAATRSLRKSGSRLRRVWQRATRASLAAAVAIFGGGSSQATGFLAEGPIQLFTGGRC